MPQVSVIRWVGGAGWLVLGGGGDFRRDETLEIDTQVLSRTVAHGPLVYLWSAGDADTAEAHIEYLAGLGGRTGYLLDLPTEHDPDSLKHLSEAGIIILGDGPQTDHLHGALSNVGRDALQEAYYNGATIYAQGRMARSLGAWMPGPLIGVQAGLGLLPGALIYAPYIPEKHHAHLTNWLTDNIPQGIGLGIQPGNALALSGMGELETWGGDDITILLGKDLMPPETL
ncbi:MAG: hypothetical protein ACLFTK_09660 [Anaerolineales bacterium]